MLSTVFLRYAAVVWRAGWYSVQSHTFCSLLFKCWPLLSYRQAFSSNRIWKKWIKWHFWTCTVLSYKVVLFPPKYFQAHSYLFYLDCVCEHKLILKSHKSDHEGLKTGNVMIFESIYLIYCVRDERLIVLSLNSGFLQHVLSFSSGIII